VVFVSSTYIQYTYIYRVCFYFIRFPSHSGPLLPSRPLLSAFVCEWNLMTVYKRPESLREVSARLRWRGATRGLIGGPPEWAAGEPLAAQPPTPPPPPPFVCTYTGEKPETARTVTSPRRENSVSRIRSALPPHCASEEGPKGTASGTQTTSSTPRRCVNGLRYWRRRLSLPSDIFIRA